MDNLGSQVGQKMRSAVKAKLIELGTGGAAGYIDDELPDYVMIMVANKRSKAQMIADLSLFLGTHTELFVTWLHEVLQKLQEVTLPAAAVHKTKRKSSDTESTVNVKKERKEKKKEKKLKKLDKSEPTQSSITEVFASHLLEKAKKTAIDTQQTKKESSSEKNNTTDDFDIPTITEISEQNSEQTAREKDLNELAELQKKINQAKRQLKGLESDESDESEDEDFLNIKEDAEELEEIVGDKTGKKHKEKSPASSDCHKTNEETKENHTSSRQEKHKKHTPIVYNSDKEQNNEVRKKKSIHERLGFKPLKSSEGGMGFSKNRRVEKELYVPSFRRKEVEKDKEKNKVWESKNDPALSDDNDRDRERVRERERERERDRDRDRDREGVGKGSVRKWIGSRVIVAPPKPECKDDDEENVDRTLNSLIKIKPRPPVSPSKQASKNLLLRAVAEAQKSTALVKPKKDYTTLSSSNISSLNRIQKLYTKSYRDRNREAVLKRVTKDNIVIEVNAEKKYPSRKQKFNEDEYVPEPISDRGDSDNDYVYVPQTIELSKGDDDYNSKDKTSENSSGKTQFVVTLDGKSRLPVEEHSKTKCKFADKTREKYISKHKIRVVEKNSGGIEIKTIPVINAENANSESPGKKSSKLSEIYKKPKEIKKIIIKNDSEDEDSSSPSKDKRRSEERSTTPPLPPTTTIPSIVIQSPLKRKRSTVSPIKFDLDEGKEVKRKSKSKEREETKSEQEKEDEKVRVSTKKPDSSKKYENIPDLLSSVPVDSAIVKAKSKDRCKYFPSCSKGDSCEFHHPTLPCKAFPNCKFAEKCLYLHPKCKFDLTCNRIGCNFSHSVSVTSSAAPPLSSHVVPVQNYKSITATPLPAMCKYYPNCTNGLCNFYHPKLCRFGKNCMNKVECNFYHHELPPMPNKDKFKWVASLG